MHRRTPKSQLPLPIVMRWREADDPLPVRLIRTTKTAGRLTPAFAGQPWTSSGDADRPFDFSGNIRRLVADIAMRCPDFKHLQMPRILVAVTQARTGYAHGLQARVTPLRFPDAALTHQRRGVTYHIQRYFLDETEFLYVMSFCLPRFLDQTFEQKFVTLFHELYHIHPEFNGDLRRHEGRYQFHTHCQRDYDRGMMDHARDYLLSKPDPNLSGFLRLTFAQLQDRHGSVTGIVVPRPKIIPLIGRYASAANITGATL